MHLGRPDARMPVISNVNVVIPAFNAAATIGRAIACCLQSVQASDIIVVLDGPDSDLEQAARSAGGNAIHVIVQPSQQGASACRNVGLQRVEHEFVMFLDADDYFDNSVLSSAVATAQAESADLVFGRYCFENPDGTHIPFNPADHYTPLNCGTVMKNWLMEKYTPPCAVLWRSNYIRDIGGWDESLQKNQDGDLILRALCANARLALSPGGRSFYVQGNNTSRITRRHSAGTLDSQLTVLDKLRARLADLPFDPSAELASSYYNIARLAYTRGHDAFGAKAEQAARSLGLKGHPGSGSHTILSSVLGLAGKQKLARGLRACLGKQSG